MQIKACCSVSGNSPVQPVHSNNRQIPESQHRQALANGMSGLSIKMSEDVYVHVLTFSNAQLKCNHAIRETICKSSVIYGGCREVTLHIIQSCIWICIAKLPKLGLGF